MPRAEPKRSSQRKADPYPACSAPDCLLVWNFAGNCAEPSLATLLDAIDSSAARPGCCSLRCIALPARFSRISGSWHFGERHRTHYYDRADGALPVQPQSHLSIFHPARARIVDLVE